VTVTVAPPVLIADLAEVEYHAHPALSSTQMKSLLRSPAHYRWGLTHRVEKPEFDLGHLVHAKVLGIGMDVAVIPGPWTTKAAKEAVDAARAAGRVPAKPEQASQVSAMAEAVLAHPVARALFSTGQAETSAFWTDNATGVPCRARFDWTHIGTTRTLLVDLKTVGRSAQPTAFARSVVDYGYDVQAAHYLAGYEAVTGDDSAAFLHVVVETDGPYGVTVGQLDDTALRVGAIKAARAREIYRDCAAADVWPAYSTDIEPIVLPAWAVYDAEERYL